MIVCVRIVAKVLVVDTSAKSGADHRAVLRTGYRISNIVLSESGFSNPNAKIRSFSKLVLMFAQNLLFHKRNCWYHQLGTVYTVK